MVFRPIILAQTLTPNRMESTSEAAVSHIHARGRPYAAAACSAYSTRMLHQGALGRNTISKAQNTARKAAVPSGKRRWKASGPITMTVMNTYSPWSGSGLPTKSAWMNRSEEAIRISSTAPMTSIIR